MDETESAAAPPDRTWPNPTPGGRIYPFYVTATAMAGDELSEFPTDGSSLHFLDEPVEGMAVQEPFPGWGPASAVSRTSTVLEREDGSSGP